MAESCDGVGNGCPSDAFEPSTFTCRPSAGACDPAETCTGSGVDCPADVLSPSSTVCRPSAGACDVVESCTGTSAACPADAVADTTTVCRPSAGACDIAESCDGTNPTCPADAFQPSTLECRPSAGDCDPAETCTGSSASCPTDTKSTAECRPSVGPCDVAESCDGVGNSCPPDQVLPAATVCRAATGACDVAETCDGTSGTCPADAKQPDGTTCDDGNQCTSTDVCTAGVCGGTPLANGCVDHFLCYKVKASGFAPLTGITLSDVFESGNFDVLKAKDLCPPADKNGEGTLDPVTHLASYSIKPSAGEPKHVRQTGLVVANQIGSLTVDTTKADTLLVPSAKDLANPPPPPNPSSHNVNHYKCYRIKVTTGTPKFPKGVQASVADQFTSPAKLLALKKPKHLCVPVDKESEGIKDPSAYLFCYQAKPVKGQPKHVKRLGVNVANQFGLEVVTTLKEDELCVPSSVTQP